jgi:hypothetical protein
VVQAQGEKRVLVRIPLGFNLDEFQVIEGDEPGQNSGSGVIERAKVGSYFGLMCRSDDARDHHHLRSLPRDLYKVICQTSKLPTAS